MFFYINDAGSPVIAGFPGFLFFWGVKFVPADVDSKKKGEGKQKNRGEILPRPCTGNNNRELSLTEKRYC